MFCPVCGKEFEDGNKFCRHCGNKVTKELKDITKKGEKKQQIDAKNKKKKANINTKGKKQKGGAKLLTALIFIILLAVAGYFGYQYANDQGLFGDSNASQEQEDKRESKEQKDTTESKEDTEESQEQTVTQNAEKE